MRYPLDLIALYKGQAGLKLVWNLRILTITPHDNEQSLGGLKRGAGVRMKSTNNRVFIISSFHSNLFHYSGKNRTYYSVEKSAYSGQYKSLFRYSAPRNGIFPQFQHKNFRYSNSIIRLHPPRLKGQKPVKVTTDW